ncbi:hypothetical protein OF897_19840 [Chryseobacterium formosus]|uniref:NTF2 fold immunity protein domain-containing protein n=1 Tax=Chryseobacterium formosus TaxID=1537363 RepID=A0ABT3XX02_9FLAO|nr:hypothetical protein [Chryseobacterium formosus]MCX8526170.1 hypothetical protein [Chryseobacterium formosus]
MTDKALKINTSQTPEKFIHSANEIITFLVESLQKIDILDKEVFERNEALLNPKEPSLIQPGEMELVAEYTERRKMITDSISLKPQEDFGYFPGKPSRYDYMNDTTVKIDFIMKSNTRAVIEIEYEYFTKRKDQFIIRNVENNWKIESKNVLLSRKDGWEKKKAEL